MVDRITPEQRSAIMRAIKGKDTKPELAVRRLLHALGYRFRKNMKGLPGSPDLAFTKRKKVVQVHGCFWHGHSSCRSGRLPSTRQEYWRERIETNKARDARKEAELRALGWQSYVVWECETRDQDALSERLRDFLGAPRAG